MWHFSFELSGFITSPGTACTVLYCLLWDGSDGVLDRACNVLPFCLCALSTQLVAISGKMNKSSLIVQDCSGFTMFRQPMYGSLRATYLIARTNMGVTIINHAPNHHRYCSWYKPSPNGWFISVIPQYPHQSSPARPSLGISLQHPWDLAGCEPCARVLLAFRKGSRNRWPSRRRGVTPGQFVINSYIQASAYT